MRKRKAAAVAAAADAGTKQVARIAPVAAAKKQQQQQKKSRRKREAAAGATATQKKEEDDSSLSAEEDVGEVVEGNHDDEGRDGGGGGALAAAGGSDVCEALMARYARSSATQHRHLCASAAAIRSLLVDEGLPLTPPAYFAAAITALRDADRADREAMAALSSFLSILLPLVPARSVSPPRAKDAASAVVSLLQASLPKGDAIAAPVVRSLVGALGVLVQCLDLDDWSAVHLPLDMLLKFAVDRRPKVRKYAQVYVEKVFSTFHCALVIKKASKLVQSLFRSYVPLVVELGALSDESKTENLVNSGHMEVLHVLNVLKTLVPYLSKKIILKFLFDIYKLFNCQFSLLTRHILRLLEVILEHLAVEVLESEAESIIYLLTAYMSITKKNPIDTVLSASTLLKIIMKKLHVAQPSMWIKNLPHVFSSVAGYLDSEPNTSKHVMGILKELISCLTDWSVFPSTSNQSCSEMARNLPESSAFESICTFLDNLLGACTGVPNEHTLAVISDLFLKLGEFSLFFMKGILHKLSKWAMHVAEDSLDAKKLQESLGSAVISMGPEKMLSVIPVSLDAEKKTCSNMWLTPILKKYVIRARLQFFVEHIVPLTKSIQDTCSKVKKLSTVKDLQSCVRGLWDLLPAFCHYPTDTSLYFDSLAKVLIDTLEEDPSLYETIALALQELVNENKCALNKIQVANGTCQSTDFVVNDFSTNSRNVGPHYSKKIASRNIKALASGSMGLIQKLADIFFDSSSESCIHVKEAIGCLASVLGSSNMQKFFFSLLEKFELINPNVHSENNANYTQVANGRDLEGKTAKEKDDERRCMIMDLASSFVEGADENFIYIIFDFIKPSLLATDGVCRCEAYYTLSRILKEHTWFCFAQIDQLMDLLVGVNSTIDATILRCRFSCLHFLLIRLLENNGEKTNTKAFLILNQIILTLKDSKQEIRKSAYDALLAISCSLKSSQSSNSESPHHQLCSMIMGYFSGSSPHIMSGAISALSLLIYKDADHYLSVPNLFSSILVLLQNKANEVIKAVLGFVKVLVSCLSADELKKLLPDIVNGILPWSSVSKNHFRSKVRVILEIMIRRCGTYLVSTAVPDKYMRFLKTITEQQQSKTSSKEVTRSSEATKPGVSSTKGGQKRMHEDLAVPFDGKHSGPSTETQRRKKHKNNVASKIGPSQIARRSSGRPWFNSGSLSQARPRGKFKSKQKRMDEKPK